MFRRITQITLVAIALLLGSAPVAMGQSASEIVPLIKQLEQLEKAAKRAEALATARRIASTAEKTLGSDRSTLADVLGVVAASYRRLGSAQDSVAMYRREIELLEATRGTNRSDLANRHHSIAHFLRELGRNEEAERPATRALKIWGDVHGSMSDQAGSAHNTLALILEALRKDDDAEHHAKRALEIWEHVHGRESWVAANALHTLVRIMRTRGRWADAEKPARKVLEIWRKGQEGPESGAVANASNTLADILIQLGKYAEAEKLTRDVVRIWERIYGRDSSEVANARNTLAASLEGVGERNEAIRQGELVLTIWAAKHGAASQAVGTASNNLAWKYLGLGNHDAAEKHFQRTLEIWSANDRRPWKPSTVTPLSGLARISYGRADWSKTYARTKQAVDIAIERSKLRTVTPSRNLASRAPSEVAQAAGNLDLLAKATYRLAQSEPGRADALLRETFAVAQWRLASQAADALAEMASRLAKGPALADVVRQRQDLSNQWQEKDKALEGARLNEDGRRGAESEAKLKQEIAQLADRIARLDETLRREFADYSAIATPTPLDVAQVQAALQPTEAMVLMLGTNAEQQTPEESFIWLVTKTGEPKWFRTELGTKALTEMVAALRCGLDADEWSSVSGAARCATLTGREGKPGEDDPLPFNFKTAHDLYTALLGPLKDEIANKQLLIVPSGPLTSLPFHVLVTQPPMIDVGTTWADFLAVTWLARTQAVTTLPSVASLKALRPLNPSNANTATKPYLGYGDPVLEGDGTCKLAPKTGRCPAAAVAQGAPAPIQLADAAPGTILRRSAPLDRLYRGGRRGPEALAADVKKLCPLPDTADEINCVAQSLGAINEARLGKLATEASIKKLSVDNVLAQYKVLHFATHGLLAGDLGAAGHAQGEPALVMTPPDKPVDADDDSLLTASEVASLKLDADWVILSACNTAGGQQAGAEALSGLARVFFYAGARSLLVSHWPVYSNAAVRLITGTFANLAPNVGRVEAHRLAMEQLMNSVSGSDARNAHPAVWAPFVVVGEGAAAR